MTTPTTSTAPTPPPPPPGATRGDCPGARFLSALFSPGDRILCRPVETWNEPNGRKKSRVDFKGVQYIPVGLRNGDRTWHPYPEGLAVAVARQVKRAEATKANVFFGVCPRFGTGGKYDLAWQIRVVRTLWADVDDCAVGESLQRCEKAGLPRPSIIVNSGNGVHLYWLLSEPYLIDDAGGDPPAVHTDWIQNGGKRKPHRYLIDPATGEKLSLDARQNVPALSPKALHIQDVLAGIASKIGGDHTTDLPRSLRIPGTLNRKGERSGQPPKPCELIECDPGRRYPIDQFKHYVDVAPTKVKRERLAAVKLPTRRKLSPRRQDRFNELVTACAVAPVGQRSEADFALCAFAIETGQPVDEVWPAVASVGKFAEGGRRYFDRTWEAAANHTREKIVEKAVTKQQRKAHRKPSAASSSSSLEHPPLTDLGNGERLVRLHGPDLRFCWPWSKWLVWDGQRWRIDDTGGVVKRAKDTVRNIYTEAAGSLDDDERKSLADWARASERRERISAMIDLARSEEGIPVLPQHLDTDPWLFNCPNGTLDLRTGELRDHRQADYITKLCPTDYLPDATCPTWKACLDRIFVGNTEIIGFLQRLYGYCLTGSTEIHLLPIFWGAGSNGKSTVIGAAMDVMGTDYAMKAPHQMLMMRRGEHHPTELADLFGKRFIASVETAADGRLNEALIKDLTGGDRQRARRMREDHWEFSPTHKLILATNHKPEIRDTTHSTWRRVKLIPFDVKIPDEEQDPKLPEKLRAEAPGILAWIVQGTKAWREGGLAEPKAVRLATSAYRAAEDQIAGFLSECCVEFPDATIRAKTLFGCYKDYCGEAGEEPIGQRKFGQALTERGFDRFTNNGTWYRGIDLKTEENRPDGGF